MQLVLCARLIELRKNAGLSQRQLAERLGREQSVVARIELGERRLDVVELFRLLKALDADCRSEFEALATLFEEVESTEPAD